MQNPKQKTPLPRWIDSTMISCARSCLKKFELEFVEGYRPQGISVDLHAGGAFAVGVEETQRALHIHKRPLADALAVGMAHFYDYWGDFVPPEWKKTSKTRERTWEAVEDYFTHYGTTTDHVQPFTKSNGEPAFEFSFGIPLEPTTDKITAQAYTQGEVPFGFPEHPEGGPWVYAGRVDMLGTYEGRPCVLDNKTSKAKPGANWSESWDLRSQFMGYCWASQQLGIPLDTVIVRGTAILKELFHQTEAIKTYDAYKINLWHEQLRRDMWRIRRAWDEGYFDYNLADACTAYGNCIFIGVCGSRTQESWLSNFERKQWNPLAKNPVGDENVTFVPFKP